MDHNATQEHDDTPLSALQENDCGMKISPAEEINRLEFRPEIQCIYRQLDRLNCRPDSRVIQAILRYSQEKYKT